MRKMLVVMLIALCLFMITACSKELDKHAEQSAGLPGINIVEEESSKDITSNGEESNDVMTDSESELEQAEAGNSEEVQSESQTDDTEVFDVEQYLSENYAIENTYFSTEAWENEDTGRTEYIVNILPVKKEFGEEIDELFKSESVYFEDIRVKEMFDKAELFITEIPQINKGVHIESVLWKSSEEEEFPILLIQDRDQITINN